MPIHRALIAALATLFAVVGALGLLRSQPPAQAAAPNVTARVELLGSPLTKGAYARNVWDMQQFGGRIYLGHGNRANDGPDPNAGPVPIWYYDPAQRRFVSPATIEEEQINQFRVLNGKLYIPGDDPRGSAGTGTFYRLDGERWARVATLAGAVHTSDLAWYNNRLFAGLISAGAGAVMVSDDQGGSWQPAMANTGYVYNLFSFKGQLYALWYLENSADDTASRLHRFDGKSFVQVAIAGNRLAPQAPSSDKIFLSRIVEQAGNLLFIGSQLDASDTRQPYGLYVAPALDQARLVTLPVAGAIPYDILQRGGTAYVLAAAPRPGGGFTVLVFGSADLRTWSELFRFDATTFARSFEELNGDFYFGLGTTKAALAEDTGDILRVAKGAYAAPPQGPTSPAPASPPQYRVLLPLALRTREQ